MFKVQINAASSIKLPVSLFIQILLEPFSIHHSPFTVSLRLKSQYNIKRAVVSQVTADSFAWSKH